MKLVMLAPTEQPLQTKQPQMKEDQESEEQQQLLLLHLIRVVALYLYAYFAQHHYPLVAIDELWQPTSEFLAQDFTNAHELLVNCITNEMASNQFDGLLCEKKIFGTLRKHFRQHQLKAETQWHVLIALLSSYLSQLQATPIVQCRPNDLVVSTLEYLVRSHHNNKHEYHMTTSATALLYPLVNAIDSLSTEQREALDALTTLWKWLTTAASSSNQDTPSPFAINPFAAQFHPVVIRIEPSDRYDADALGACFVQTLLQHADHIFRHDSFTLDDPLEALTSDTEEEEDDELLDNNDPAQLITDLAPKLLRTFPSTASKAQPETEPEHEQALPPAAMCVGIAAAAGTIAAAFCVLCC